MASSVQLESLTRQFTAAVRPAVDALSLDVKPGEVVSLVGPSGCGKSTTLRMIAGLETPDSGVIKIGDKNVTGMPPQDRDVAMVFQGFALYPHMKVKDILAFPLKMRKVPPAKRSDAVRKAAELLNITALLERFPAELSGGEQQRVAMGRAIVREPEVFLFDEPLSNLDAALRSELRIELKKLLNRLQATALYVTHDQVEAMTLSDRICVLNKGKLEQIDPPRRIYEAPGSVFVASFFGSPPMNLLTTKNVEDKVQVGSLSAHRPPAHDQPLIIGFRPEVVHLGDDDSAGERAVRGRAIITAIEPLGAETHLELSLEGQFFKAKAAGFFGSMAGETLSFSIRPEDIRWFSQETGLAL